MAAAPKPQTLPVLIGSCGGINPAGRWGNFSGYGFLIREMLSETERTQILLHQARLMSLVRHSDKGWVDAQGEVLNAAQVAKRWGSTLDERCFIRKPTLPEHFDPYAVPVHRRVTLEEGETLWPRKNLPSPLPSGWTVVGEDPAARMVRVHISQATEVFVPQTERLDVSCAGMIPDGVSLECKAFGPKGEKIPRGLKLALYAANDAMKSLGVPFASIAEKLSVNQIGLYIASAMGQTDLHGLAGYMQAPYLDRHPASTCVAFSLNNMAADFVAAYVLGSLGHISCEVGACATFLVNLYNAARDIRQGKIRFALVGAVDAPIHPWVISAYASMKALGRDEHLPRTGNDLDRSRASIPFGDNFGFTMAEGSQFVTLLHPDLAVELGIEPLGSLGEVFAHSDGWKGSISKPGIGNYVTFGRCLAAVERDLGAGVLQNSSYVSAHGSSTPQNRQTESKMFDDFARVFGISNWPVTGLKSWLGHTLGPASGDQLAAALASFRYQTICKIRHLDRIPDDVHRQNLRFCQEHLQMKTQVCVVNSKGFGGHNATGAVYAPEIAKTWLSERLTPADLKAYQRRCEETQIRQRTWEKAFLEGSEMIDYDALRAYDEEQIESLTRDGMRVRGLPPLIEF